ncbi:hypothetical protein [Alkalicoccobacillus plakortidis]|uniref:Uncharacterized protein n=1 Tax=Alkalicoccobacillus plakortidis TaxID=444060 RepID=A0ABT0XM03_9BACI|nr:hypothetical protein [Alkalicoccobacillus plakortidis]MCM2676929.1 hypothetical protein [Alkalicoccobacillus plakortidis]
MNSDKALSYIDTSHTNDTYTEQFQTQFEEKIFFNEYTIGEPIVKNEQETSIPVTIVWDEYWKHEFIFNMEQKNQKWVIVPDVELLLQVENNSTPPEQFVRFNLNYVNMFENETDTKIELETLPHFALHLIGMPSEVQYDASNQAFTLPIMIDRTRYSTVPRGSATFPDGTETHFESRFTFPPN